MAGPGNTREPAATVVHSVIVGVAAAGIAGALEFAFAHAADPRAVPMSELLPYMVFYALAGLVVGLIAGGAAVVITMGRRARGPALGGAATLALVVLATVGAHVNIQHLPGITAPVSLAFDLLLLAACAGLATWILRRASGRRAGSGPAGLFRSATGVGVALFCALLVVAVANPPKRPVPSGTGGEKSSPRMNVLLLVVDALRPDHLGCYGYERDTSPNIDRLAAEGVLFDRAYAHGSHTKPTTATIVTSLYPSTHGVRDITHAIPDAAPVLMEELDDLGYRTAVLSANSFVSSAFGFGRGVDYAFSGGLCVTRKSSLGRAVRNLVWKSGLARWSLGALDEIGQKLPHSAAELSPYEEVSGRLNDMLLEWVDADPQAPFFAYVHYMEPHMPLAPPPPYDTMFDDRPAAPHEVEFPFRPPHILPFATAEALPESERTRLVAQYDATIAYFDAELGRLLETLEERGLAEDTLVLVTADHGEEFHDHGHWGHGVSVYEELIRVPLIVWCPGRASAGRRIAEPVRHVDIMPTLLSAAGVREDARHSSLEGVDLWPAITGEAVPRAGLPVYAELISGKEASRALRLGDMKVIYARSPEEEVVMLFDLAADPLEKNDLADSRPVAREELLLELRRMYEEIRSKKMQAGEREIDEATEEVLKALGYVQ
ncbi:MAG: sulfatase-like hydrolase/transferase [Candidatus Eisenbacteria bacterium]|nr:sulfatase-like hydrolase/transferase [Candidatus Eisenbacteria bacterium]